MAIDPRRLLVGQAQTPVLCVDGLGPDPAAVRELAAALAPFPPATNNYPGLRRVLDEGDGEAFAYVVALLEAAAPFIAGAFDAAGFDLVEASFSLVTTPADQLTPPQRSPHFDSVDADLIAVLHYLSETEGTAFYRHRASGIELITPGNCDRYVAEARSLATAPRYICGSTAAFEQVGAVAGRRGRLVAYPGRLLHSGLIGPDFHGLADPRTGRLTANFFIRLK